MNNTALYIHVPWCRRRCPYCDFYFEVGKPSQDFIDNIKHEWQIRKELWHNGTSSSLYFGGGTPSMLDHESIGDLLQFFKDEHILAIDAEITLEANPEDINESYVANLYNQGINRISLGVQSFDDDILRKLGRKHNRQQIDKAIDLLLDHGFNNLSLDLIIGVMDESITSIANSLEYIIAHNIPHVSTYMLTIEEGTFFAKSMAQHKLSLPDQDMQADHYTFTQNLLLDHDYKQYDISSYAQDGYKSRHNQVYWGSLPYLGLGPGAHSMRLLADGSIIRAHNANNLLLWKDKVKRALIIDDHLEPSKALLESLAFGLRNMSLGVNPYDLAQRHQSILPKSWDIVVKKYSEYGYLIKEGDMVRLSHKGALFADAIMRDIFGD